MNVTVRHLKANSAVVSWDVLEDEVVIGFAISQQVTLWEGRCWWVREEKEKDEAQDRLAEKLHLWLKRGSQRGSVSEGGLWSLCSEPGT